MSKIAPRPSQRCSASYDPREPRRPQEAAPYVFPTAQGPFRAADAIGMLALGSAALCMLTRFVPWAWLAILLSIASIRSTKNLVQTKADSNSLSGWSCLLFSFTAITAVYLPILQGVAQKAPLDWNSPFKLSGGVIPLKR
ncbi:hypothetical protein BCR35DRAFT_350246 [Leucosporidium creatinivorum]|uniref:Uncharacterized protein n=1 Tax=Leucosporidium creatinivorum TaxID=106004 RepID=A0A1Y2G2H6_9BASI|nr:hypothetical protein BCR35DRAFT_350246 [Leucosporidium creatinivorum]